jgi:hypothetical protein
MPFKQKQEQEVEAVYSKEKLLWASLGFSHSLSLCTVSLQLRNGKRLYIICEQ